MDENLEFVTCDSSCLYFAQTRIGSSCDYGSSKIQVLAGKPCEYLLKKSQINAHVPGQKNNSVSIKKSRFTSWLEKHFDFQDFVNFPRPPAG